MILAIVYTTEGWATQPGAVGLRKTIASACRRKRFKAENGAEDCYGQYDILHSIWPVASDSYRCVPHPCCRDDGHQLGPSSPTREGTCSHNYPWGGTMWIHPDLLNEVSPWTMVSHKRSR